MATIIIRNSTGSGVIPSSLQQGELAINTKDGRLFYGSGSGNIVKEFTGSGGGSGSTFPYTGSAIISGSLVVTGSLQVGVPSANNPTIDTTAGTLGRGTQTKVDWINAYLQDSSVVLSVDWENRILYDGSNTDSFDWGSRILYTPGYEAAFSYSQELYTTSNLYHQSTTSTTTQTDIADQFLYVGQIITGVLQVGVNTGDLIYLDIDGTWKAAKAGIAYGADKMLGICSDAGKGKILIEGDVAISDNNSGGPYIAGADYGLPVYISTTTSQMTISAPSGATEVVRLLGHIYHQSSNDSHLWLIKFRPSNDWYVV